MFLTMLRFVCKAAFVFKNSNPASPSSNPLTKSSQPDICSLCNKSNHVGSKFFKHRKCYVCGKTGHIVKFCTENQQSSNIASFENTDPNFWPAQRAMINIEIICFINSLCKFTETFHKTQKGFSLCRAMFLTMLRFVCKAAFVFKNSNPASPSSNPLTKSSQPDICSLCNKSNHVGSKFFKHRKCYVCGKTGHIVKFCTENQQSSNIASFENTDPNFWLAQGAVINTEM